MKFLIAGMGSIGRRHLRNLVALGEQDILLYRTHRSTLPDEELAGYPVVMDLAEALATKPDGVIISNPTALHLEVAIPAANAGCHLLLEKPISHSMVGVEDLSKAVRHSGSQVLVGYQFRFHPGLQRAASFLKEGAVGRPLSVRAVYGEYLPGMHPWEDYRVSYSARPDLGGGVILTLCHPLDTLRRLLGDVKAVWCFAGQINDFELSGEDTAEIGLQFEQGCLGSVRLDYNQRPSTNNVEIVGTHGTIRWDNLDGVVSVYTAAGMGQESAWQRFPAPANFERNDMFLAEMRHFLTIIKGESEPICTLEDGIQTLKIVLAAQRSAKEGILVQLADL